MAYRELGDIQVATSWPGVGHTPSKTSSPLLSLAMLACAGWYTHIEIFHDFISETVLFAI
jgi:hypothetical protein